MTHFLLLWMVPGGNPKDLHFLKTVYTHASALLQWISSPGHCRVAAVIIKTVLCLSQDYYPKAAHSTSCNSLITVCLYLLNQIAVMIY